jgi:protein-tyrosine phosphatase
LDFQTFDLILAMDRQNLESLRQACPSAAQTTKIKLMTEFCEQHDTKDVPDPYFGGQDGFDHVIDLLEDACDGLLKHLEERAGR